MLSINDIKYLKELLLKDFKNGGFRSEEDRQKYLRIKEDLELLIIPDKIVPEFINVKKQDRVYEFANGTVEIKNIISINVSKSGTHRLNTEDGKKHIVPSGWLHIEFNADEWTF